MAQTTETESWKILIVDDEKWVRQALKTTLERTGLPLTVAGMCANGIEALDWLREHRADLALIDIKMPVMNGLQLAEAISELPERPDLAIVSGHDDFEYARQALRFGVFDYLLKPVDVADLRDVLVRWARRREEKRAAERQAEESAQDNSPIDRAIRYIRDHLGGDELTLQETAKHVCLNPSYFSQLFKQRTGRTFIDYVTEKRMETAAKLLQQTELRVQEISNRVGYTEPAYFSNQFRKWSGLTPSEYRKKAPAANKPPRANETR
ncbi:response regulator [Paenibacillus thermoaerophilus]|uniref:Response regulator n=1 Tax=Paenibacillus thermoaerophilus TaxID=1215385 RepID=A0ABW2V071_9BACL|nr:response regulator [Paenibacillus thermoaerophilus]TMV15916.1 response regulator [Paenibacillus thermoaerophilus]